MLLPAACDIQILVGGNSSQTVPFKTPGYPLYYSNCMDCQWRFFASLGQQVKLVINNGESEFCCDKLEVGFVYIDFIDDLCG